MRRSRRATGKIIGVLILVVLSRQGTTRAQESDAIFSNKRYGGKSNGSPYNQRMLSSERSKKVKGGGYLTSGLYRSYANYYSDDIRVKTDHWEPAVKRDTTQNHWAAVATAIDSRNDVDTATYYFYATTFPAYFRGVFNRFRPSRSFPITCRTKRGKRGMRKGMMGRRGESYKVSNNGFYFQRTDGKTARRGSDTASTNGFYRAGGGYSNIRGEKGKGKGKSYSSSKSKGKSKRSKADPGEIGFLSQATYFRTVKLISRQPQRRKQPPRRRFVPPQRSTPPSRRNRFVQRSTPPNQQNRFVQRPMVQNRYRFGQGPRNRITRREVLDWECYFGLPDELIPTASSAGGMPSREPPTLFPTAYPLPSTSTPGSTQVPSSSVPGPTAATQLPSSSGAPGVDIRGFLEIVTTAPPLKICKGNCNDNNDCDEGLACRIRDNPEELFVSKYCSGTPQGEANYCIPADELLKELQTMMPTAATAAPTGIPTGGTPGPTITPALVTVAPTTLVGGGTTTATGSPTSMPTGATGAPTTAATANPTGTPTATATGTPTGTPTSMPTAAATTLPTAAAAATNAPGVTEPATTAPTRMCGPTQVLESLLEYGFFPEAIPTTGPTEPDIDALIVRTVEFYSKLFNERYGTMFVMFDFLLNNSTFTNGAERPFKMDFDANVCFEQNVTSLPSVRDIFTVMEATEEDYQDYIRNYVWTEMGEYFFDVNSVIFTAAEDQFARKW